MPHRVGASIPLVVRTAASCMEADHPLARLGIREMLVWHHSEHDMTKLMAAVIEQRAQALGLHPPRAGFATRDGYLVQLRDELKVHGIELKESGPTVLEFR